MQFLVLAHDGTDEGAPERRMTHRDAHLALAEQLQGSGNLLYGVAMLDADGGACGSVLITEFDSREELDGWLATEPYITGHVWRSFEVIPCQVGPMFLDPASG